jgi:glycosyltransferase involved in cell wall biosynthesis
MWPFRRADPLAGTSQPLRNDPSVPLASIMIRSMDRKTLPRALLSAARQSWGNVEIVVVAACGRQHKPLPDNILGRPLRMVWPDAGQRLTRPLSANAAVEAARGEWMGFLDDDDELLPEHLTTLLGAPRPGRERVIYASASARDKRGKAFTRVGMPGNHAQLYFHNRTLPCATVFHRSLIDEGLRFDADFPNSEDHDFQIACATRTAFLFVDAVVAIWNSELGTSGSGFGANEDRQMFNESVARVRRKWHAAFERWLGKPEDLLEAGKFYLQGGDLGPALECLERALVLRPADGNALNLCGLANFNAGNIDRAEKLLTKAQKRLPKHNGIRENLAMVRAQRGASR